MSPATRPLRVLLLGALPEEVAAFRKRIRRGRWLGHRLRLGLTGVGKTAAAAATQLGICRFRPDAIIFTGVAGALDRRRRIGEIGVGVAAIDADLDIRAWRPGTRRGEHPFGGARVFASDAALAAAALGSQRPGLFPAYIASGSAFLDSPRKADFIRAIRPELAAEVGGRRRQPDLIEMEGSAVLQVAAMNGVPALALRAVSDEVDGDAVGDFTAFVATAVEGYVAIVEHVLASGAIRRR